MGARGEPAHSGYQRINKVEGKEEKANSEGYTEKEGASLSEDLDVEPR